MYHKVFLVVISSGYLLIIVQVTYVTTSYNVCVLSDYFASPPYCYLDGCEDVLKVVYFQRNVTVQDYAVLSHLRNFRNCSMSFSFMSSWHVFLSVKLALRSRRNCKSRTCLCCRAGG